MGSIPTLRTACHPGKRERIVMDGDDIRELREAIDRGEVDLDLIEWVER